jgi:membrane associated rhomboid family serine protease
MTNTSASWRLNQDAGAYLRITLLIGTLLFALSLRYLFTLAAPQQKLYLFVMSICYVATAVLAIRWFLLNRGRTKEMCVSGEMLTIPRSFFHDYRVGFSEIKSVEKFPSSKALSAIVIGRYNKSSIMIQRRYFNSSKEFEEFVEFADQLAPTNRPEAKQIDTVAARREAKKFSLTAVLALSLVTIYGALAGPDIEELSELALIHGGLIKESLHPGELYRIASTFFLHGTPIHLLMNILALSIVGRNIEIVMGQVRFVIIFLCAAITGSLLSLAYSDADSVIGASGGILGLLGSYCFLCLRHQRELPGSVAVSGRLVSLALGVQILGDVAASGVDIFSHIGGFSFGLVYTCWILRHRTTADLGPPSIVEICVAATVAIAYIIGLLYFFAIHFAFL